MLRDGQLDKIRDRTVASLLEEAIYRFSTGARVGEVFGEVMAEDAALGLFCVSNSENDLVSYYAATVRERKRFTYATSIRFAEFLPARKELLVLTGNQKLHAISMEDLPASPQSGVWFRESLKNLTRAFRI
jgi:hypothetical protein